jgi:membrane protein implicated in regulation of membrane protease activity
MEMQLPKRYWLALGLVVLVALFIGLSAFGLLTVESLFLLLVNYVFQIFAVTVLAALGGVFLGMLMAHRMLASRGFTPFERELLQTLADVKTELQKLQAREAEVQERLDSLEKRMR